MVMDLARQKRIYKPDPPTPFDPQLYTKETAPQAGGKGGGKE